MSTITIRPFAAAKLLMFAALALLGGCHLAGIAGDGNIKSETRPVADFTDVEANGAFRIDWVNGPAACTLTTDANLLTYVETSVSGHTLRIHSRQSMRPTEGFKVKISSSALSGVRLTGAVRFSAANVVGKGFYLETSGATRVNVDGHVNELVASLTGASKLDAGTLQSDTAELSISDAGRADVVASETLKVSISGAGKVIYAGNPKRVEKQISGAGSIKRRE